MPKPPWTRRERACNKYDQRGIPIDGPCKFNHTCWYIHPDEPEWAMLEWSTGYGRLVKEKSRSRSRSRERVPRESGPGWDRARLDREKERERERGRDSSRPRDRDRDGGRDKDRNRDRDRGRRSPSSRNTRPRRLSPPRSSRSPLQRRRSSYRDRSPPPPPRSSTSTSSRPRRDSIASSAGGDPPPTTTSSAGFGRPQTPPRGHRALRRDSEPLLGSPEERKPDIRELERARLLARAEVAKEQQRQRDLGIAPEVIDLSVSTPSAARAVSTPTATSPPPPGLTPFKSFSLPKPSPSSSMSMSATTLLQSPPPPPPPSDIPPPTPNDTFVSAFNFPTSAMNIDSPATMTPPVNPLRPLPDAPDFDDILQDETLVKGSWDARVHLLTDLVELETEVEGIKADVETIRKLSGSTMLPEEARARYDERLAQAEAKLQTKQAAFEKLRDENIEASSVWPIGKEQMERDIKLLAAYKEMVEYLANLTKVTNDLQRELAVLGVGKMPEVPVVEALKQDVEAKLKEDEEKKMALPPPLPSRKEDDAMEVDVAPPAPPPLPSRSANSSYAPSNPATPSTLPPPPPLPHRRAPPPPERTIAQQDLDDILAKLDRIEKDVYAIDDAVLQKENELREEFKIELDTKTDDIYEDLLGDGDEGDEGGDDDDDEGENQEEEEGKRKRRRAPKGDPEVEDLRKRVEEMIGQTRDGVKEVDEMTEILYNFQTRLEGEEGQLGTAMSEHQAALDRQAELQTRLLALEESHRASTSTIETLHHTLRAHIASRPPSPPTSPSPPLPSASILMTVLRDPLIAELRRAIVPVVEEVRAGVKRKMDEEVREVYGTVWERVEGSVRLLGGVERVLREGGVPVDGPMVNGVGGKEGGAVNGAASH